MNDPVLEHQHLSPRAYELFENWIDALIGLRDPRGDVLDFV